MPGSPVGALGHGTSLLRLISRIQTPVGPRVDEGRHPWGGERGRCVVASHINRAGVSLSLMDGSASRLASSEDASVHPDIDARRAQQPTRYACRRHDAKQDPASDEKRRDMLPRFLRDASCYLETTKQTLINSLSGSRTTHALDHNFSHLLECTVLGTE